MPQNNLWNEENKEENKGKPWSDEELIVILSDAPTKLNREKYAKCFRRGLGAVEEIYKWATTSQKTINEGKMRNDSFVKQIKKIAKQVGWIA